MTVSNAPRKQLFNGSDSTGPFTFNFAIIDDDHITVSLLSGSVSTELVKNTDYTITLVDLGQSGGSITLTEALATGDSLLIEAVTPLTQEVKYSNQGTFYPETHEQSYDKLTFVAQEQAEDIERCLKIPTEDEDIDTELPLAADRANKYLAFDADGNPIAASLVVTGVPTSDFWEGVLNLSDVESSRAALGIEGHAFNLCINPTFLVGQGNAFPAAPSDNDYICDKWRILMENASAVVPTRVNNSFFSFSDTFDEAFNFIFSRLRLTVGAANNNKFGIFQPVESYLTRRVRGRTVSLSAYLEAEAAAGISNVRMAVIYFTGAEDDIAGDPISSWGAAGTNPTLATNWSYANVPAALSSITGRHRHKDEAIAIPVSAQNLGILIWIDDKTTTSTTDFIEISNVQLEIGNVSTELAVRPYATELALCQREYYAISGNNQPVGMGQVLTSTTGKYFVKFPTTMRATPTLGVSNVAHFNVSAADGTGTATSALALNSVSNADQAILDASVASGLTAGNASFLTSANASALLEFKARL